MKRILKRVLPRQLIQLIKDWKVSLDQKLIVLFANNGILASMYYLFFSRQFDREHKSVLAGRLAYQASLQEIGQTSILLRRNIHRLEKGLIMRPRRPVFAQDYIAETVTNFALCTQSKVLCGEELKWATDVIKRYFRAVHDTDIIGKAREEFETVLASHDRSSEAKSNADRVAEGEYSPYPYTSVPESSIDYQQLHTLFQRRRSVRWYDEKDVELDKIHKAIAAASLAPSACNRQPYRFHVEINPDLATKIAKCAMGTAGFAENLQAIIVVLGDLSAYPKERDRHVIYIDAGLASMQLMLSLETLGLSSCPINWPDIENNERKLANLLNLNIYERPVMLMAVGYAHPEGGIPYSQKKGVSVLVRNHDDS